MVTKTAKQKRIRVNMIGIRPQCYGDRHLLTEKQKEEWCAECIFVDACKKRTEVRHGMEIQIVV